MPASSKNGSADNRRRLDRQVSALSGMLKRTANQVKLVLDGRVWRCDDDCPGWFFGSNGPERCDDCATQNGYADVLYDEDMALLPEAREPRLAGNEGAAIREGLHNADQAQLIAWLRSNVSCRRPEIGELAAKEAVRLAGIVLGASPTWVAEQMLKSRP